MSLFLEDKLCATVSVVMAITALIWPAITSRFSSRVLRACWFTLLLESRNNGTNLSNIWKTICIYFQYENQFIRCKRHAYTMKQKGMFFSYKTGIASTVDVLYETEPLLFYTLNYNWVQVFNMCPLISDYCNCFPILKQNSCNNIQHTKINQSHFSIPIWESEGKYEGQYEINYVLF